MKSTIKVIPFEKLQFRFEDNVRDPMGYDYSKGEDKRLLEDIKGNGLIDPLEVYPDGEVFRGLKGFRRFGAIQTLWDHDRSVFESLFKDGVKVVVHTETTEEQRANIMCDHGVRKLDKVGRHRVIRKFLGLGWSEPAIARRTGFTRPVVQLSNMLTKLPERWEEARIAEWRNTEGAPHIVDVDIRSAYNAKSSKDLKCELDHCKGLTEEEIWNALSTFQKPASDKMRSKSDVKAMLERIRHNDGIRATLQWALGQEIDLLELDK